MTIKFELPSDDALVLKHFGTALTNIAADLRGDVVDSELKELVITDPAIIEKLRNCDAFSVGYRTDVDTTSTQYESLSADGANVAADVEDDTPPPPASEPTPDPKSEPVTDVVEQGESVDVPAADVELDTNGLPWDGRIHSANKSTNSDGSWRNRRQAKDDTRTTEEWKQYIASVEAELKGALGNTDDTPPPPPAAETAQDDTPPPPPPATDVSTPFDQAVTADLDVPPPPPADDAPAKTFPELMKLVTSNAAKGSVAKVQAILAERDLGSLQTLNTARPDMVSTVYAELERQLGE